MTTQLNTWQNANYTAYAVTVLFFLLSLWGISKHELWLDEAHHYLLARDSTSFQNLLDNTRYEGHPILWNVVLYWITRVTIDPFWMQVLHISIMTLSVGVFLRKAPFPWVFKLLFIFGYFMFFEYNILSRNYSLGVLFIFLACSFYPKRASKFILIATLLGFACNSHAIFVILASTIMAMITLEHFISKKLCVSKNVWIGVIIFGVLALVSLLQIIPPSDTSFFERGESISLFQKVSKSMSPFFKSLFLFPDVTINAFWNSHILVNYNKSIAALLAIASLSIPYILFYKNRSLLIYIYFGIFATAGFFFITMMNAARYYGILYFFLITALWFEKYMISDDAVSASAKAKKRTLPFLETPLKKVRPLLIYSILGLHFISGVYAFSKDLSTPFTTAKQTAQYLKENQLFEKTIATKACNGTPLSAYIGKPVYFTRTESFESYCIFNRPSAQKTHGTIDVITSLQKLLQTNKESIIFITYEPFFDTSQMKTWTLYNEGLTITFLTQLKGSILKKGDHYIYEVSKY